MGYLRLSECGRVAVQVERDFEDFSFRDVAKEMERAKVFSAEECRSILGEATEAERTEKMLFLLMYRTKELKIFQEVLLRDYDWLSAKIDEAVAGNERFGMYEKCIRESNIPNNRSGVIYRTDLLWQVRKALESLEECHYLVLHGNTGSGKRWLAIDACCDYRVIRAMNYKIFWLSVTDCVKPEKILSQMERLKVMLLASLTNKELIEMDVKKNTYISVEAKMEAERSDLRLILRHESLKDCLVVLSDLTNDMTQNAFDLHCKMLVTTRNLCSMAKVNERKKLLVSTNCGLTESECFCLFEHTMGRPVLQNPLRGYINEIHRVINGSPDLASKIAKNLMSVYDGNVERRLKEWIRCLGEGMENNRTKNVMEESLKVLDNEQAELYKRLAIFPPNCLIPIPVLARYFSMNTIEVEEVVRKFEKYSLLEIDYVQTAEDEEQMMCRIHFICAQYLTRSFREDLIEYHRDFVDKYNIEGVLDERSEPNVLSFPNDHYFYTFIGYHLCAGRLFDTFVELFSDFGFLEIKIRESGLTNTIGDLKLYHETRNAVLPLFIHLLDFLPNVEERIYESKDLTLLQQALGGSQCLRDMARQQLSNFPERLWFRMNCGEKWRKIVQLCSNPSILRFLTPNSVLVAQKDNNIVQADLSNNYKYIPNVFSSHETDIIQMEVFSRSYLISLDASSVMYCWYVGRSHERSQNQGATSWVRLGQNGNRRQFVGHTNYSINDAYKFNPLQKITLQKMGTIVCFHTFFDGKSQKLLCALATGHIFTYNWTDNQFTMSPTENFSTALSNIKCLQYIGNKKLLVLDTEGKIHCFNLQSHSHVAFSQKPWGDKEIPITIHFNLKKKLIYCVFTTKIVLIKIKFTKYCFLTVKFIKEIYRADSRTTIQCSALAKNGKFLVLGTKTGIIVFDCAERCEVLQNCVTEHVTCIDVFTSHEVIVIYGNDCRKNIANIFEIKVQSQSSVTLQHHLFEVIDHETPTLYAVDTAKRLHEYSVQDTRDVVKVTEKHSTSCQPHNITAIAQGGGTIYLGCDDGRVFHYSNGNCKQLVFLANAIELLKSINSWLVIGTNSTFRVLNQEPHEGGLVNCYATDDEHLLAITKSFNVQMLHVKSNRIIAKFDCNSDINLVFCDYVHPYLMTCAKQQSMTVYCLSADRQFVKLRNLAKKFDNTPTSIALSPGDEFFAVGFQNGGINIYDIGGNFKYLQTLESHKCAVTHLAFSPWRATNRPRVLISLGEQVCFWNITFVVNNIGGGRCGVSQLTEGTNRLTVGDKDPWCGKIGASEKPELLSCVKFVGNCASKLYHDKEFEKFLTIDDEGETYVLILNDSDCRSFR